MNAPPKQHGLPRFESHTEARKRAADQVELIAKQLALFTTVSFLLVTVLGFIFYELLFRSFGVDYLVFANAEDFFMAGLRRLDVLFVGVLATALLWLANAVRHVLMERTTLPIGIASKSIPWWNAVRLYLLAPIIIVGLTAYALTSLVRKESDSIRNGWQRTTRVVVASGSEGEEAFEGRLLACSADFAFVFTPDDQQLRILRKETILRIVRQLR